jgi:Zn finger protein HypA/HybF involved in hydrogenase expression
MPTLLECEGGAPGTALQIEQRGTMAEPVPTGSDVSAGTYRCTNCGEEISTQSVKSLPPCPKCSNNSWETVSGGDSKEDPYPDR